jgi:hypothetical protein
MEMISQPTSTIGGVIERYQRPLTPNHTHAIRGRARMADPKSIAIVIYGLVDSDSPDIIRYVGKTAWTPERRLAAHLRIAANGCTTYKARWMRGVVEDRRQVHCIVIATADTEDAGNDLERFHIARLRAEGARLTNLTDGGDGLSGVTEETKQKMRAARVGFTPSATQRRTTSERMRRRYESLAERTKTGDINRGKPLSASARRKLSEWRTGTTSGPQSAEHKRKISAALTGRPKTPEHVAKVAAAQVGRRRSPETVAKLRRIATEQWATRADRRQSPEHRRKINEAIGRYWARRREAEATAPGKVVA